MCAVGAFSDQRPAKPARDPGIEWRIPGNRGFSSCMVRRTVPTAFNLIAGCEIRPEANIDLVQLRPVRRKELITCRCPLRRTELVNSTPNICVIQYGSCATLIRRTCDSSEGRRFNFRDWKSPTSCQLTCVRALTMPGPEALR
jgi:hypothetical protein